MKKRKVAIVLSLILCTSSVCQTFASGFSSPDEAADPVIIQQDVDVPTEEVSQETEPEELFSADEFSAGEEAEPVEEISEEELFSSEEAAEVTEPEIDDAEIPQAFASGKITVNADQWVASGNRFRLKKATTAATTVLQEQTEAVPAGEDSQEAEALQPEEAEAVTEETPETEEIVVSDETLETAEAEELKEEAEYEALGTTDSTQEVPEGGAAADSYYTFADGIVYVTTIYKNVSHSGYYLFDNNGYMVTGQTTVTSESSYEAYFTNDDKAVVYKEFAGSAVTPYTSDLGQQKKNYWLWTGSVFRYYDENGKYISVSELDKTYQENGKYTGYYKIDGEYYSLKKDGTPRVGNVTLTVNSKSAKYYFQTAKETGGIPGQMFHGGWKQVTGAAKERWLYYNTASAGSQNIGKAQEKGVVATRLDTSVKGNKIYLLDKYGYILKSTMKKAADGRYYCSDSNGVIYRNALVKYKGSRYYFGSTGKRAAWKNSWHRCPGASDRYYYFGSTEGKVSEKTGWQKVETSSGKFVGWFYFNKSGNHYTNKLTSTGYYFLKSGKLAGGIQEINGKKYIFAVSDETNHNGKMYKNTLVHYKNQWFYASESGALRKTGWQKINGNWYCFENYRAVTNDFRKKNGVNGYLDSTGKYSTGWVLVSNAKNQVRYIDPDGDGFVKNGSKWINGYLYYFDSKGYRINDVTNRYSGPYVVEVDRVNGVMTVYNSAKNVPLKTIRVSVGLPYTPTPTGTYVLSRSARWQPLMGPSWGQYGTHVVGAGQGGIFVHSVSGGHANSYSLPGGEYNKLGNPASHGCIRVCVADAKWVFENCNGSTIRIFDGAYKADEAFKGPLGRNPLVPLRGAGNFDPTDPAVNG